MFHRIQMATLPTFTLLTETISTRADCIARIWQAEFADTSVTPPVGHSCISVWHPGTGHFTVFCDHFRDVVDRIHLASQSSAQPAIGDITIEFTHRRDTFGALKDLGYVRKRRDVEKWSAGSYAEGQQYLRDKAAAEALENQN